MNSSSGESVNSKGSNYIRYNSGLQICFGTLSGYSFTFPAAFSSVPVLVPNQNYTITSTAVTTLEGGLDDPALDGNYIAIGWWK